MAQKLPFQGIRGVWDVEWGLAFFLYLPLYFSSSSAKEWAHPSTGSVFFFTIVDRGGSHAGLRMHRPQLAKASRAKICVSRYNNMEVQTSRKQWLQPLKISKIYKMDQYGTHFLSWSDRNVPYHLGCSYELFRKYFCSEMSALNMRSIASIWSQSEFRCRKECPLNFSQNMKMATVGYPKKTVAWWDTHWFWPNRRDHQIVVFRCPYPPKKLWTTAWNQDEFSGFTQYGLSQP